VVGVVWVVGVIWVIKVIRSPRSLFTDHHDHCSLIIDHCSLITVH
jgi:hypothetical protein